MLRGLSLVVALAALSFKLSGQTVVISGVAKECNIPGQERGVPALDVKAFDPASNSSLVGVLRSLDTVDMMGPPLTRARWSSDYDQLKALWTSATALTHDSTSSTGSFTLNVPSSDSVLILTFDEVEGVPAYYTYRMVGARSNASLLFDMSSGGCGVYSDVPNGGQGTILQTATGLIFQDDFNRADGVPGSNWDIRGTASFWSIVGNVLTAKLTNATPQQILVATSVFGSARGEMVVQARMRRVGVTLTSFPGIQARDDATAGSSFLWVMTNTASGTVDEFRRILGGGSTVLNTSPAYNGNNVWQQFKLVVKDSQQQGWKDGVLTLNLNNTALNAVTGRAGLYAGWFTSTSDYHEFDDFAVYKRNVITMSGLPTGYQLHVGTRYGAESGGIATIDFVQDLFPFASVEVADSNGILIARLTPSGGVWGGDTYSYTP